MKRLLGVVVLTALMAGATTLGGWWTVPIIAAIWVRVFPHAAVRTAMAGAASGWAALLIWTASRAPILPLTHRLAGVFQLPPWGLLALTLLLPALLAGAAARAVRPASFR